MVDHDSDLISYVSSNPDWEDVDQEKILESKDLLIFLFSWGTRTPPTPPRAPSPNGEWKNTPHLEFLENKDVMILLYPWMMGPPPAPPTMPPPPKGIKSDGLTARAGNENNQQLLPTPETLPSGLQNSVLDHADQNRKVGNDPIKATYEKTERKPPIWQDNATAFQQQRIQRDEFKDTSGVSMVAWTSWVCGLVVLSNLNSI